MPIPLSTTSQWVVPLQQDTISWISLSPGQSLYMRFPADLPMLEPYGWNSHIPEPQDTHCGQKFEKPRGLTPCRRASGAEAALSGPGTFGPHREFQKPSVPSGHMHSQSSSDIWPVLDPLPAPPKVQPALNGGKRGLESWTKFCISRNDLISIFFILAW
mgnify:FL=1